MTRRRSSGINVEALTRIDSRDMLILPDTSGRIMHDLSRFYAVEASVDGAALEASVRENLEMAYGFGGMDGEEDERKPFVYNNGTAIIPIHGTLLNRCNWSWGFCTGYQFIRRMLNLALDDSDVEQIVFDVDSPGGEAAGCFELAREIMASRRVKPSLAMVDSLAASGGMALAGCATKMYAIPSARIGSIGVYRMHVSYEESLKQDGIKVTFAKAGDHKVDGNPYQDLPASVLKNWEEAAGKTWDDFITLVAESRDMSEADVRATQAEIYRADEALAIGLINAVKTPTEAVSAFLAELADCPSFDNDEEEIHMADPKKPEVTSALTEADLTRIADIAAQAAGKVVGAALGALDRKTAIKDHAAAIGPKAAALAKTLIDNDAIDADAAIVMLDAAFGAPVAAAAAPAPKKGAKGAKAGDPGDEDEGDGDEGDGDEGDEGDDGEEAARAARRGDNVNHFEAAMGSAKHPNAGAGKAKGGDEAGQRTGVNPLIADHAAVTGASWSTGAAKPH